ncbi:cyclophilin-like fold protein [Mangrovicoccus ximenensis]|uniref:cyclophilin-like fold protein n=1 Tax=Mangrovicoccus ximenensis TaxID=1911570 RepID=UPI000D38E6DF|nr:cyclophilin-like fold protein [Mangrovicoccus ximenensis]
MTRIRMTAGETEIAATLDDTPAGRSFAAMLPLDLEISDYHGIEKIADLPGKIDTSEAPRAYKPEAGDLTVYAPWGNLAIFYKPFSAAAGLVRLGAIDGAFDGLLKKGNYRMRIEAAQ